MWILQWFYYGFTMIIIWALWHFELLDGVINHLITFGGHMV